MFLLEQEPHPAEDKYGLLKTAVRPRHLAYLKSQSIRPGIQDTREQMLTTHSKTQQILRYHFQKTYEEELQNIHTSIDTKKGSTEIHLHIGMQFTFQHRLKMLPTPTNPIEIFTSHTTRLRMPLLSMQFF
jgi:hypothetical protein